MIPGLPSIGGGEILIILAIVLLFFGAKRIPELARSLGKGTQEFRKGFSEDPEETKEIRSESTEDNKEEMSPEEKPHPQETSVQTGQQQSS
jgi:sec-independent protein translocase protein TatA